MVALLHGRSELMRGVILRSAHRGLGEDFPTAATGSRVIVVAVAFIIVIITAAPVFPKLS